MPKKRKAILTNQGVNNAFKKLCVPAVERLRECLAELGERVGGDITRLEMSGEGLQDVDFVITHSIEIEEEGA